MLETEKDHI